MYKVNISHIDLFLLFVGIKICTIIEVLPFNDFYFCQACIFNSQAFCFMYGFQ